MKQNKKHDMDIFRKEKKKKVFICKTLKTKFNKEKMSLYSKLHSKLQKK